MKNCILIRAKYIYDYIHDDRTLINAIVYPF